jgi:pyruvate dehydrogenase E2 component (dihydrolipoamide acetyltransferase)
VLKKYCNIALALDSDRGLLAPVIRDVAGKSVLELAEEAEALGERLRGGKAEKKDMEGGTFTVTNVGGLGGTAFNPIINHPQVAILGMARARLEQLVEGDLQNPEVRVRYMLPLMLAFDHRVIDGADAARFMADLIELLKNPARLLVELR